MTFCKGNLHTHTHTHTVLVFSLTRSILWARTAPVVFVSAASAVLTVLSGGFTQRAAICGEQDAAKANTHTHTHTPEQAVRYLQNTHNMADAAHKG